MAPTSDLMDMIQLAARDIIKNELTLEHWDSRDGNVVFQLKLGEKTIGKPLRLSVDWKQDHGHGGGTYINGLTLEVIE